MSKHAAARPRATVVIRVRNEVDNVGSAIAAVRSQSEPSEVLVLDNASDDGSAELATALGAHVEHIPSGDFNYGSSCNLGARLSTTPFVVYLSGDAVPADANWLASLLSPFADSAVTGTYGSQEPRPGLDPIRTWGQRRAFQVDPATARPPAWFSNVNSAVRRTAWQAMAFAEHFDGGEDFVWEKAQLEAGNQVVYVPAARVMHSHNDSLRKVHRTARLYSRALFPAEQPPSLREYASRWLAWSGRDALLLLRAGKPWWAAWTPTYYGAHFLGEFSGRRKAAARAAR